MLDDKDIGHLRMFLPTAMISASGGTSGTNRGLQLIRSLRDSVVGFLLEGKSSDHKTSTKDLKL